MLRRMHVRFHADIADFAAVAEPLYRRDRVLHTVELTWLSGSAAPTDSAPLLLSVWDGPEPVGAALQAPPYPLLCTGLPPSSISHVVTEVARVRPDLSGARGSRDTAVEFARCWRQVTGVGAIAEEDDLLYRLGEPRWPEVAGVPRRTTEADHDLLVRWVCEFVAEAFRETPNPAQAEAGIAASAAAGGVFALWTVDDVAVSMAGVRAPAAGASRIGPVYTPMPLRGNGYGSAATAAAARWAHSTGADEVVLFADAANPVSNAIYRRMGFEPVTRFARVAFGG